MRGKSNKWFRHFRHPWKHLGDKADISAMKGCGFWLEDRDEWEHTPIQQWWACVIPDESHDGLDHILVRQQRDAGEDG